MLILFAYIKLIITFESSLKQRIMKTTATYTKIVNSEIYNNNLESIGFRRLHCLPNKMRRALGVAYIIENNTTIGFLDFAKKFFSEMTEEEYCMYLRTH
jgi:hypothetical protein